MKKTELQSTIKGAPEAHAKDVLGEEQFLKNKVAKASIIKDFESGANWMYHFNLEKTKK